MKQNTDESVWVLFTRVLSLLNKFSKMCCWDCCIIFKNLEKTFAEMKLLENVLQIFLLFIALMKSMARKCYAVTRDKKSKRLDGINLMWNPPPEMVDPVYETRNVVLTQQSLDIPTEMSSISEDIPSSSYCNSCFSPNDVAPNTGNSQVSVASGAYSHLEAFLNQFKEDNQIAKEVNVDQSSLSGESSELEFEFYPPELPANYTRIYTPALPSPIAVIDVTHYQTRNKEADLLVF